MQFSFDPESNSTKNARTNTSARRTQKGMYFIEFKGSASGSDRGNVMEIYQNVGKKANALLDPFGVPARVFLVGIQRDKGELVSGYET